MNFPMFVDIVLEAAGYHSPSEVENDICLGDHNYTNLIPSSHMKHEATKEQTHITRKWNGQDRNRGVWKRNCVLKLSEEEDDEQEMIHIIDNEEGEGRRVKREEDVRKMHNTLEKRRRATQRNLIEALRACLPGGRGVRKRWSQFCIINSAISHMQRLREEEAMIREQLSRLRKEECKLVVQLLDANEKARSASHLSVDSGADSGIINSEDDDDDDQELHVA